DITNEDYESMANECSSFNSTKQLLCCAQFSKISRSAVRDSVYPDDWCVRMPCRMHAHRTNPIQQSLSIKAWDGKARRVCDFRPSNYTGILSKTIHCCALLKSGKAGLNIKAAPFKSNSSDTLVHDRAGTRMRGHRLSSTEYHTR
ncbi:hypothetical protein SARC_08692, partial [Sphaeroforma arctica JP610]